MGGKKGAGGGVGGENREKGEKRGGGNKRRAKGTGEGGGRKRENGWKGGWRDGRGEAVEE